MTTLIPTARSTGAAPLPARAARDTRASRPAVSEAARNPRAVFSVLVIIVTK